MLLIQEYISPLGTKVKLFDTSSSFTSEAIAEDVEWTANKRALLGRVLKDTFYHDANYIKKSTD